MARGNKPLVENPINTPRVGGTRNGPPVAKNPTNRSNIEPDQPVNTPPCGGSDNSVNLGKRGKSR